MTKKKRNAIPMQDLGISKIPTPAQVFEWFQKMGRYTRTERNADYDGDTDGSLAITKSTSVEFAIPKHKPIEHEPVKVYSPEEIAQYEKERADD